MPVILCNGACISLYLGLHWSVLDCIRIVLVNVLASVLAHIEEKIGMYLNTNTIHANTCWYVLGCFLIHTICFLHVGHVLWFVLWMY